MAGTHADRDEAGTGRPELGSVDAFLLVANDDMGTTHMITGFTIPGLLGNIIGGGALFALIVYTQIMKEV